MNFTQQIVVTGMSRSKGTYEGKPFDYTAFFCQTDLDDRTGNKRGTATTMHRLGTSDEYAKYEKIPVPFTAEASFELMTSGKDNQTSLVLVGLKPLDMVKKAA